MTMKRIDPVMIRKAVKDGRLEFFVENNVIYCRELPDNGEKFIVGNVIIRKEELKIHVAKSITDNCQNLEDSYGCICVSCNRCGRFTK